MLKWRRVHNSTPIPVPIPVPTPSTPCEVTDTETSPATELTTTKPCELTIIVETESEHDSGHAGEVDSDGKTRSITSQDSDLGSLNQEELSEANTESKKELEDSSFEHEDTIYTAESQHDSSSGIASDGPSYCQTSNNLSAFHDPDPEPPPPYHPGACDRQITGNSYIINHRASSPGQYEYMHSPDGYHDNTDPSANQQDVLYPNIAGYTQLPGLGIGTLHEREQLYYGMKRKYRFSPFDNLPDDVIIRIFGALSSDQLCRCARVCRRWYNIAWEPFLWTSIRINDADYNVDKALKVLTKKLSYETPTVCVMIEHVNLNNSTQLTDKGLRTLAKRCPELRHLELQGCNKISNIAVYEAVSRCVNLQHLNLLGCSGVSCISLTPEANMQACSPYSKQIFIRHLDMTDCINLDDAGLQIIASFCSQLTFVYLRRCVRVSDLGVQYLANYCPNIREFSISDCKRVTDFGMKELSKLGTNLRYLSVAKCDKVSDVGLKYIAKYCYKLRYLNVRGCEAVSDESVELLALNCKRMKSLDVGKCDITDDSLQALASHCTQLKKLSLKSCDSITDKGIIAIAQSCHSLQQLNIQDCHLTVESYRAVKKCCKRCIIEHTNPGFY